MSVGRNYYGPNPVHCYGCCECQREHRLGIDAKYEDHIMLQSKHGTYVRGAVDQLEIDLLAAHAERVKAVKERLGIRS